MSGVKCDHSTASYRFDADAVICPVCRAYRLPESDGFDWKTPLIQNVTIWDERRFPRGKRKRRSMKGSKKQWSANRGKPSYRMHAAKIDRRWKFDITAPLISNFAIDSARIRIEERLAIQIHPKNPFEVLRGVTSP